MAAQLTASQEGLSFMKLFVTRKRPFALAPTHDDRWILRVSEVTVTAKRKEVTRRTSGECHFIENRAFRLNPDLAAGDRLLAS
jgi:hypothetical protein